MSLADCSLLENPSQLEDALESRENSNRSSNSNCNNNSNINSNSNSDNNNTSAPSSITSYPSTEKVVGNRIGYFNNDINDSDATLADATFPSTQKVEEYKPISKKTDESGQDDRIEYIEKVGPYDIICGRNNGAHNWVGNRRFRVTIMMNLKKYTEAPTREEKTHVIKSVIDLLLDKDGVGARFIKKVGEGMYERLRDKQIREKVGHAFRDMISLEEKGADELEAKCFR